MINSIFTAIKISSMISGSIIGYNNGKHILDLLNHEKIKGYKDGIIKPKKDQFITELRFASLISGSLGCLSGYYAWYVILPYTIYELDYHYDIANNVKKFVKK
jgi:hypothetical protein